MARHRLARAEDPGRPTLRAREVPHAQVAHIVTSRADGRSRWTAAGAAVQASAYQAEDDLVFGHPHTGHPLERSQVSKRFKRILKRAGVREVRFHESAAHVWHALCGSGRATPDAAGVDGHADVKTTMVYTHYAPGANEAELVNGVFAPADPTLPAQPERGPTIQGR